VASAAGRGSPVWLRSDNSRRWGTAFSGPGRAACGRARCAHAGRRVLGGRRAGAVAARIDEYCQFGIDSFILSGYPHLEETCRFAELVLPRLPLAHAGPRASVPVNMGPFGEAIAGDHRPALRAASS